MSEIVYINAPDRAEHAMRAGEDRAVCGFVPDLDWWTVVGTEPFIEAFVCKSCSWSLQRAATPAPRTAVTRPERPPTEQAPRHHLWEQRIGPELRAFCVQLEEAAQ